MSSIQDEDKVQALFPGSPYPAFGICIGIGRLVGGVNDMKAFRLEDGVKDCISVWIKKRAGFIQDTKDIRTQYG
jgi:hypothetical protein